MIFQRDWARKADTHYQSGQLRKAADAYRRARRYEQAAQVLRELGEIDEAVELLESQDLKLRAAEMLQAEGRHRDAVGRYEAIRSYRRAAEAALRAKMVLRAARLFEQADMHERAAEVYLDSGEVDSALRALEHAATALEREASNPHFDNRLRRLAEQRTRLLTNIHRYGEAATLLARYGEHLRAASLWERAGEFERAARAWHETGHEHEALRALEQADSPDPELAAIIYAETGQAAKAAEIFAGLGKLDAAAAAYEEAGHTAQAAALWERVGRHDHAAELFARVERFYDAGRCWAMNDRHEQAAEAFLAAEAPRNAADALASIERWLRAGELYLEAGLADEAREVLRLVPHDSADAARTALLLVPLLVDAGERDEAEARLRGLKKTGTAIERTELFYCQARVLESSGDDESAVDAYRRCLANGDRHDARARLEAAEERLRQADTVPREAAQEAASASRDTRTVRESASLRETGRIAVAGPRALSDAGLEAPKSSRATQRVALKPSPAETGGRPQRRSLHDTGTLPRLGALHDDVPVTLGARLDPWWSGADFHRATDERDGSSVVAVSFALEDVAQQLGGFRRVMRLVEALRHPAILELSGTLETDDRVLLFYPDVGGEILLRALEAPEPLEPQRALHILVQLCEALNDAHKLGVTHQWLSPRTVVLDAEGRCKMVGLGLREFLRDPDPTADAYISPEVREGGVIGPTSDVYSLGMLAMELLGAQLPVDFDPDKVRWPPAVAEEVPSSLRTFLVRCLAESPLERPSTAEVTAALAALGFVEGQVLGDRYEIEREIGRGGMSRVYRALDRELDDTVAIKTVLAPALGRTDDEERLLREVRICRRISHPNVVRVHDIGRFPGGIFIIMELLDGPGLDEVIAERGALDLVTVRRLLLDIAEALAEAHRMRIVHRDLKPGNVIVVGEQAKVLDFGIARMADGNNPHLTRTGEVIGSPLFMAPEQIRGEELTGACDLYSLGVIAFTLLAGREPFNAETPTAVVLQHLNDPPPDVREFRPDLPDAWFEMLTTLLAKKPADRYASAEDLAKVLRGLPSEEAA